MKKILIFALVIVGLNAQTFNVKQNGNLLSYEYIKKDNIYTLQNKKTFANDVKVIIEYGDKNKKNQIEKKYNLLNGKVFYGNLFIYEQNGDNVLGLFENLSKQKDIQSVYPNWISTYKKF